MATEACKKGRVLVNGMDAKPSRDININDIITVRKLPVIYTYKVIGLIDKRQPAKFIMNFFEDMTSVEELEKLKIKDNFFISREKGKGRPTKKERRIMDNLMDNFSE